MSNTIAAAQRTAPRIGHKLNASHDPDEADTVDPFLDESLIDECTETIAAEDEDGTEIEIGQYLVPVRIFGPDNVVRHYPCPKFALAQGIVRFQSQCRPRLRPRLFRCIHQLAIHPEKDQLYRPHPDRDWRLICAQFVERFFGQPQSCLTC